MLKKFVIPALLILFTLVSIGAVFADDGPGGNKRKGKYTYRKLVKACFDRGAVKSETPAISPADQTQAHWKKIFDGKDFSEFGCDEEWKTASDGDILDIYTYFYSFAKDSPTPATCK